MFDYSKVYRTGHDKADYYECIDKIDHINITVERPVYVLGEN